MRVSVIGCGYLGAVHAVAMAKLGHEVTAIDVDSERIEQLSKGLSPFFEPGFDELLTESLQSNRLKFTNDYADLSDTQVHFLAVGTPQSANSLAADLSHVNAAVESLSPHLAQGSLLVGKSTVPVGTAARISQRLSQLAPQATLAWNPEFLREGFAIADTLKPDRIVYGVASGKSDDPAVATLDEVYVQALSAGVPRIVTGYETSELVKVAANAFLATKISFINAMAEISDAVGANVTELADALGHDTRIGRQFLNAGLGFGGGCLPKDIRAFTARAQELGVGSVASFLTDVDEINQRRRTHVIELAATLLAANENKGKIAVLGVTFKPNSDDVRDSPALDVIAGLTEMGASVVATDPKGISNALKRIPNLHTAPTPLEAITGAQVVILATEWEEYRNLDPIAAISVASPSETGPHIIDARNVLDRERWIAAGWTYRGIGR